MIDNDLLLVSRVINDFVYNFYYRADDFVVVNGKLYKVFRCIKMTQLTNYSYSYYVMNGKSPNN